jgi:hypothetical protein
MQSSSEVRLCFFLLIMNYKLLLCKYITTFWLMHVLQWLPVEHNGY